MLRKPNAKKSEKIKKDLEKSRKKPEKLSLEQYEKKVLELVSKGLTAERIGEELRKQEIHAKEYSKKISKILEEKNVYINPNIKNIEEKMQRISGHFEKNKQDKRAMREKERIFAQLRKLKKYHKL